jgi:hypothetical protein
MARLQQVARHGFSHDANADETDIVLAHELPPGVEVSARAKSRNGTAHAALFIEATALAG